MNTQHSIEELSSLKYSEIRKIAQSLNIKSGRRKADKLIQSILKEEARISSTIVTQDTSADIIDTKNSENMSEDIQDIEEQPEDEADLQDDPTPEKKLSINTGSRRRRRVKRNSSKTKSTNIPDVIQPNGSTIPNGPHGKLTRSRTFEILDPETSSPAISTQVKLPIKRTGTSGSKKDLELGIKPTKLSARKSMNTSEIELPKSPSMKRKRDSVEEIGIAEAPSKIARVLDENTEVNSGKLRMLKSPDLLCNETQTVKDIEEVEQYSREGLTPSAATPVKMGFISKVHSRRSLRGNLLASKLSNKATLSAIKSVPIAPTTPMHVKETSKFTKSPVVSIKDTPVSKTDGKKTAIPRFLKHAMAMPDFSKIHAKNFKKMESVDEYVGRKHDRLRNPRKSIGTKTPQKQASCAVFKPSVISTKDINTKFSTMKSLTAKLPTTPASARKSIVPTPSNKKSISPNKKKPVKENIAPAQWGLNKTVAASPGSFQRRMAYKPTSALSSSFVAKRSNSQIPVGKFRSKQDLKDLANKKPRTMTSSQIKENQRSFLKGVRLNKRFELQMAKRGITYEQ